MLILRAVSNPESAGGVKLLQNRRIQDRVITRQLPRPPQKQIHVRSSPPNADDPDPIGPINTEWALTHTQRTPAKNGTLGEHVPPA